MRKHGKPVFVTSLILITCAILILWFLAPSLGAKASPRMQPPPEKTPVNPPTQEPTQAPTQEPTAEPTQEPTKEPTAEPTQEPTQEPTAEPTKEPPGNPTREPTRETTEPIAPSNPKPDPNCQSVVEGNVLDAAGQGVVGATVSLTGEGVSRTMMTDDHGHYGFGGLCAGTVTIVASLPGKPSPSTTIEIDGKNNYQRDLRLDQSEATPQPTVTLAQRTAQQTPAAEASMPTTGYSGWLLLGGALIGALLLLSAGARRTLAARSRTHDQD